MINRSEQDGGAKVAFNQSDLNVAVRMLSDKWKFQIVNALLKLGPLRFSHFQLYMPSISPTVLTGQLKALEAAEIVFGTLSETGKAVKEYVLTSRGRQLWPVISELEKWGKAVNTEAGSIAADNHPPHTNKSFGDLKERMVVRKLKKNELLLKEGAVCNFIGFVNSGALRSFVTSDDVEHNNDFYLPDSIVCALTSFLSRKPTNCNIEALTDTEICLIGYERFMHLVEEDVAWLRFAKTVSDSFFMRKCKRETSFLKHTTSERIDMVRTLFPGIEQLVPQYHIASYIGITPESLSRSRLSALKMKKASAK